MIQNFRNLWKNVRILALLNEIAMETRWKKWRKHETEWRNFEISNKMTNLQNLEQNVFATQNKMTEILNSNKMINISVDMLSAKPFVYI